MELRRFDRFCLPCWWKPANEVVFEADTVLFLGSNFPFAEVYQAFKNTEKIHPRSISTLTNLGNVMPLTASILGDAGQAAKAILDKVTQLSLLQVACKREEQPKLA